ncbi:MAG TPA: hypothetical protein VJX23_03915 [Candidatus Binataceae bacterium]|nr:hypothetical protein [Candidatus Binataceae bacterium]
MSASGTQKLGPVATRVAFENDDVRVWEMDLKPGEVCGLHHHTLEYVHPGRGTAGCAENTD